MVRNSAKAKDGRSVELSSAVRLMFSTVLVILTVLGAALAPKVHAAGQYDTWGQVWGIDYNYVYPVVHAMAVQPDGKVLIGGLFTSMLGVQRKYIARLNADATLDTGFDPNASGSRVEFFAVQADGKVLIAGDFDALQPNGAASPTVRKYLARLNADGSLDTGFNPNPDLPLCSIAVQGDGKVLIVGTFTTLQPNGAASPSVRKYIARLNADGTLDTAFNPNPDNYVTTFALQADGTVLIGGLFTTLQPNGMGFPATRKRDARLNADGTVDNGFNTGQDGGGWSVRLLLQADGKVLTSGSLTIGPVNNWYPGLNGYARFLNDPATESLIVSNTSRVTWTRGGSSPELERVTFELSIDGGTNWNSLGAGVRVDSTPNWQITGLSLPAGGRIRARGANQGSLY